MSVTLSTGKVLSAPIPASLISEEDEVGLMVEGVTITKPMPSDVSFGHVGEFANGV